MAARAVGGAGHGEGYGSVAYLGAAAVQSDAGRGILSEAEQQQYNNCKLRVLNKHVCRDHPYNLKCNHNRRKNQSRLKAVSLDYQSWYRTILASHIYTTHTLIRQAGGKLSKTNLISLFTLYVGLKLKISNLSLDARLLVSV